MRSRLASSTNKRDPTMANRAEAPGPTLHHLNGFAQVMERTGLAIMGALCGLFWRITHRVAPASSLQKRRFDAPARYFGSTPINGHRQDSSTCLKRAKTEVAAS